MDYASELAEILQEVESRFGSRLQPWNLMPTVHIHDRVPQLIYLGPHTIQIAIDKDCVSNGFKGSYQIAHEAVHSLSPVSLQEVSVLEEGLATMFAHEYASRKHNYPFASSGDQKYDAAWRLVEGFLNQYPDAIPRLRIKEKVISRIGPDLIKQELGEMDDQRLAKLTARFHTWVP